MLLKGSLVAAVILALAAAAGASAFALRTPRPTFLTECIARSDYPSRSTAVDVCKEELAELRLDRTLGTVFAAAGTLILVPAVIVNVMLGCHS
ncbi:hypothetical protein [Falsiroseomonas sp.]|uniref:hypothetical protein n=1 Tax=Falsiroseomonas sp. TaxID=2870721 RepID=UPI003568A2A9